MPVSIRSRLNGQSEGFLKDVRLWGIWKAMEKHGFRDYLAVKKYIMEETEDENYGIRPQLGSLGGTGGDNPFEVFIERFADFVVKKEAEVEKMNQRILMLEKKLGYYEKRDMSVIEGKFSDVIETLK